MLISAIVLSVVAMDLGGSPTPNTIRQENPGSFRPGSGGAGA